MNNQKYKNNKSKRVFLAILIAFLLFSFVPRTVNAAPMEDFAAHALKSWSTIQDKYFDTKEKVEKKIGSGILQTIITTALNTIAYDTATWLGSGKEGQEPMFLTEGWDTYMLNIGDNVAGEFIEQLSEKWGTDLCEPSFNVKARIGLGLVERQRPGAPDCTGSEMLKAWGDEAKRVHAMYNKNFLTNLAGIFDVTSNDVGIALSLQTSLMEEKRFKEGIAVEELNSKTGWLDNRDLAGNAKTWPGYAADEAKSAIDKISDNVAVQFTGDAIIDAINVFVNQLAATGFQTLMRKLADGTNPTTSKYSGDFGGLLDYEAGPYTSGVAGAKQQLKKIIEPKFDVRGDYNILAELSSCNEDIFSIGPTNCVIDERFRSAIEQQKTVAEAVEEGILRKDIPFGFITSGKSPIEPRYNEGIPYRSMLILRKFRIIPVGWEIAAEYVQKDANVRNKAYLGDMIDCYDEDDSFEGYEAEWCRGLVDPNWVLKAPKNYCAKEGYGPQIIFEEVIPGFSEGDIFQESKYIISRNDNYCADEQSCVSERDDGSCEYFGYCTEERRKWKFSGDSCESVYNTCQSFTSEDGKTIAYLKNTLEYCTSDQYGCEKYAIASLGSYDADNKIIDWALSDSYIYLNKEAEECKAKEEGCHEFIRIKADIGSNLIYNSDFSNDIVGNTDNGGFLGDWPITGGAEIVDNAPGRGNNVLKLEANANEASLFSFDHSSNNASDSSVLPNGFVFEPETNYTFSVDVYLETGSVLGISIGRNGGASEELEISGNGIWERLSLTVYNNLQLNADSFRIYVQGNGSVSAYIDNIQFEIGDDPTSYKGYREEGLVYEKIIPNYLEDTCYLDATKEDYQFAPDAPAECNNYARKCSSEEAGCELFVDSVDNTSVAAKITTKDRCVEECVGYDMYIQEANSFTSIYDKYFIPDTARSCSAIAVGCEEFTNLDALEQGGEQKEYFNYLRQCIKPNDPGETCAEFYSWEGNVEKGQQLVKYSLSEINNEPEVTADDALVCNAGIYSLPPNDPSYNPDCREFYNRSGEVFYHLYSRTISCSEDCHPYRMSYKNTDNNMSGVVCQTNAIATPDKYFWDNDDQACYYCENGGDWSSEHEACIYRAIPGESIRCDSKDAGCGEYNGNSGGNINTIVNSTFEGSDADDWTLAGGGNIAFVKESAISGQESAHIGVSMEKKLGYVINKNSHYVVSFMAKGDNANVTLNIELNDGAGNASSFGSVVARANKWGVFELNLNGLTHDVTENESLVINIAGGNVYYDNIRFYEVIDRHFLIRDSWHTPDVCDRDNNGSPYPLFMLGCSVYSDRFNQPHYLHSFTQLCQESAVGCEAVIDTDNYSHPSSLDNVNGTPVNVSADWLKYIVFDPKKMCDQMDKGCQRLGEMYEYSDTNLYKEVYIKNDPDKYDRTLCDDDGVGCDKWKTSQGDFYFKDPGDMVCEYRQAEGAGAIGWSWFKKRVDRCGGNLNICLSDDDCDVGTTCIEEGGDISCPVDDLKTFGLGGLGNEIKQPGNDGVNNWAGFCPMAESGCSEYIDPISDFSINIIFNSDFSQNINTNDNNADGWDNNERQKIKLEGNNLYILAVEGTNEATILMSDMNDIAYELNSDNELVSLNNGNNTLIEVGANESKTFYISRSIRNEIIVNNAEPKENGNNDSKIILRKLVLDYQIISEIDKTSCNGVTDFNDGCILFNERAIEGASGLSPLNKNTWKMYNPNINIGINTANQLIKVRPDRVCNSWLACKSYIKDEEGANVCFDIGTCNRLDEGGNCVNFKIFEEDDVYNKTYNPSPDDEDNINVEEIKNLSGYAKAGSGDWSSYFKKIPNNLYDLGNMEQIGNNSFISNGDFEFYDAKTGMVGSWATYSSSDNITAINMPFSAISNKQAAQSEGIKYPMSGKSFLKYNAGNATGSPVSEVIYLDPGEDYYLSFYVNTQGLRGVQNNKAIISILTDYDTAGESDLAFTEQGQGKDWTLKVFKFNSGNNDTINLRLGASEKSSGSIYIDDIQITPVLLSKVSGGAGDGSGDFYIRQSCRLYPQEDSLSCDYFDDTGIIQKGERGYCLEYDRLPGDPNACILWWPIDKVRGSGLQTGVYGYNDRLPLYYCIESPTEDEIRPYINASSVVWAVDEQFKMTVNGTEIHGTASDEPGYIGYISSGNDKHRYQGGLMGGDLSDHLLNVPGLIENDRIYLNYGVNTIELSFRATDNLGTTFLQFSGNYHFFDNEYKASTTHFDFYNMFSSLAISQSDIIKTRNCNVVNERGVLGNGSYDVIVAHDDDGANCNRSDLSNSPVTMTYTFNIPYIYPCTKLANVVTRDGRNKAWADRVRDGSEYKISCNRGENMPDFVYNDFNDLSNEVIPNQECSYYSDYRPFGALVPPDRDGSLNFASSPGLWARDLEDRPLYYEMPDTTSPGMGVSYQARMGQLHSSTTVPYIFAESYGIWNWNDDPSVLTYVKAPNNENWHSPTNICPNNEKTLINQDCAISPVVNNIKLSSAINAYVFGKGFVDLTFNSQVDSQQIPMTAYEIDWGDGEVLSISGVEMRDRRETDSPHSAFHSYDYWDLKNKYDSDAPDYSRYFMIECEDANGGIIPISYCTVKPRIKIRDNWGWCPESRDGVPCPNAKDMDSRRCVNITTRVANSNTCETNFDCNGTPAFPVCSDGWQEAIGEVIVYEY